VPFEVGNVGSVEFFQQLQIGPVELRRAKVLRPDTTGVERDAFSSGQRSQLLVDPGVVGNHACGNAFHIRAFCLFLGHLTVLNFLRSAACCFLNEVDVLLTHFFHGTG
jgi:hypothetical protein